LKANAECADDYREGALAVLSRCVKERVRIKVWTRNYGYVRGICVGYLVAFDKHWNLVCESKRLDVSLSSCINNWNVRTRSDRRSQTSTENGAATWWIQRTNTTAVC